MLRYARFKIVSSSCIVKYAPLFPIALIISLSILALIYAVLSYNHIYINNLELIVLALLVLVLSSHIIKYIDLKINPADVVYALVSLIPFFILRILSPLPLGDDIRYIASANIVPSGIVTLIGWTTKLVSKILGVDVFTSYWIIVYTLFYSYFIILLGILRKILGSYKIVYIATFASLYSLNLLIPIFLPSLFSDPMGYYRLTFEIHETAGLGRQLAFDPNLLKNSVAVLLLLILLIKSGRIILAISSMLYVLGIMYHPVYALATMLLVSFLRYNMTNYKLRDALLESVFVVVLLTLLSFFLSPYYFILYVPSNVKLTSIVFLLNLLFWTSPYFISAVLSKAINTVISQQTNILKAIYIMVLIIVPYIFRGFSLLSGQNIHFNLGYLFPYDYYLVVVSLLILLFLKGNVSRNIINKKYLDRVLVLSFLPLTLFIGIIVLSEIFRKLYEINVISDYYTYLRYLNLITRFVRLPIFIIPIYMSFFVAIKYLLRYKPKYSRLLGIFMVVLVVINQLFFVSYWGYYYRNPWATPGMNAEYTNELLGELSGLKSLFKHGDAVGAFGIHTWDVRDIIALMYTGQYFLSPMAFRMIVFFRYNYIPKYVITTKDHPLYKLLLANNVKYVAKLNVGHYLFYIFKLNNASQTKAAVYVVGPFPWSNFNLVADEYFSEIINLQRKYSDYYIFFAGNAHEISELNATIIIVKFRNIKLYNSGEEIPIKDLFKNGYRYLVIDTEKHSQYIECVINGDRHVIIPLSVIPRESVVISIKKLCLRYNVDKLVILNAEEIMVAKDFTIRKGGV